MERRRLAPSATRRHGEAQIARSVHQLAKPIGGRRTGWLWQAGAAGATWHFSSAVGAGQRCEIRAGRPPDRPGWQVSGGGGSGGGELDKCVLTWRSRRRRRLHKASAPNHLARLTASLNGKI